MYFQFQPFSRLMSRSFSDAETQLVRDYYRIETEDGARYWLFRDAPAVDGGRWWLHGMVRLGLGFAREPSDWIEASLQFSRAL
jgi:hypothetical protein